MCCVSIKLGSAILCLTVNHKYVSYDVGVGNYGIVGIVLISWKWRVLSYWFGTHKTAKDGKLTQCFFGKFRPKWRYL